MTFFCDLLQDEKGNPKPEHEGPSDSYWKMRYRLVDEQGFETSSESEDEQGPGTSRESEDEQGPGTSSESDDEQGPGTSSESEDEQGPVD